MNERITVEFTVPVGKREQFLSELQAWDASGNCCLGFRADDQVQRRQALSLFVDQMELKLRRNEHKKNWREKPIEALKALMLLEVEEFKVAMEFFSIEETRPELVDIANFALICWDRLSMLDQERNVREQTNNIQISG